MQSCAMSAPKVPQNFANKRIRGTNFSKQEELSLVSIISKYKHIIESKATSDITPTERNEAWIKFMDKFNSLNSRRSLAQLKGKYDNLKTGDRKFAGNINRSLYGTGGGPSTIPDDNPVYDEILSIINTKTVSGLQNQFDDDVMENEEHIVSKLDNENIEFVIDELPIEESEEAMPPERTHIGQKTDELPGKENTWKHYTAKNLKEKKHKRLSVYNKPAPQIRERNCLYELKQKYFQQKLQNLQNEDRRKQEKHEKAMELLQIEIEQQRNLQTKK